MGTFLASAKSGSGSSPRRLGSGSSIRLPITDFGPGPGVVDAVWAKTLPDASRSETNTGVRNMLGILQYSASGITAVIRRLVDVGQGATRDHINVTERVAGRSSSQSGTFRAEPTQGRLRLCEVHALGGRRYFNKPDDYYPTARPLCSPVG